MIFDPGPDDVLRLWNEDLPVVDIASSLHISEAEVRKHLDLSALDAVSPYLGPFLDGTFTAPVPTVGHREDGAGMFYPGETNRVFGKSESGKTWLVLHAGLQHMDSGGHFVFADYENGPAAVMPRLLALGAAPDLLLNSGRFRYLDLRDSELTAPRRAAIAATHPAALVAVDSVAGLVASNAKSSNYVDDVEALMTRDMAVLTRAGCCVVYIDHETDRDGGDGRSSGSHRKRDLISGVSLRVQLATPFRPHTPEPVPDGCARVYVDKDRHGGVRAVSVRATGDRDHFADFTGHPHPEGRLTLKLWPPGSIDYTPEKSNADKRTPLARKVITVLEAATEPLNIKTLITEISKINASKEPTREGVTRALGDLRREGIITKTEKPGSLAALWSLNASSEDV